MMIAPRGKKNRNARDMTDACAIVTDPSLLKSTEDDDAEEPTLLLPLLLLGVAGVPEVVTKGLVVEALVLLALVRSNLIVPCSSCWLMSADVSSELTAAPSALDQIQLELESVKDIEPPVQELQLEPILSC